MPELLNEIQSKIDREIVSLQENLGNLNSIATELENTRNLVREHITQIDEYIRSIQTHSTKLLDLFSKYADEIKDHAVKEINRAIASLEALTADIIRTVASLEKRLNELTETNEALVKQSEKLFREINELNLLGRFDKIDRQNKFLKIFSVVISVINLATLAFLLWKFS